MTDISKLWLQFGPFGDVESVSIDELPDHKAFVGYADHKAALTASLAREAAAFEAAGEVAAVFVHERLYKAKFPSCSYHHADIKAAVKALTHADAQATLQAMIDAAVKDAREKDALGIRMLIQAAQTFCNRVEAGEIRSKRSYDMFQDAISKIGGAL